MAKTVLISVIELIGMNCSCIASNINIIQTLENNRMPPYPEDSQGTKLVKQAYNDHLQRIKFRR